MIERLASIQEPGFDEAAIMMAELARYAAVLRDEVQYRAKWNEFAFQVADSYDRYIAEHS